MLKFGWHCKAISQSLLFGLGQLTSDGSTQQLSPTYYNFMHSKIYKEI